ncbi:MAG: DUF4386 domain-containing protein [Aquidulcibacter sp.]|jgi:hypothetical protein|uniref:DUF4386 domain-containing protein n=1 Tax=Aquidulcibacter sp. TaxID=2052990 RepID=UPI0022CAFA5A|nr:DUF4386 domain-containing protein [Aquidulcibacter sp.]
MTASSQFWTPARLTGLLLLVVTVTHMAGFQIASSFVVSGDFAASGIKMAQSEGLYRLALLSYGVSSILSVGLAVSFALWIAPISRLGAGLVLGWRLFEALTSTIAWAIRFALVDNQTQPNLLGASGAEALHRALRDASNAAFDLGAIGLALATLIGFYFLFQVRALPRLLSAIAMTGAKLILLSSVISLSAPEINIPSSIAFAVTLLSNLVIGLWLLVRGDRSSQAKMVAQQA